MKTSLLLLALLCLTSVPAAAQSAPKVPERVGTTVALRELLLATRWSWRNVSAGIPDRECVFMPDGTFRHPNFTAKFKITDINKVELHRKGGEKAIMTFDPAYMTFEVLDFDKKRRITGRRL